MEKRRFKNGKTALLKSLLVLLSFFLLYQNCSEIELAKLEDQTLPSRLTEVSGGRLPVPENVPANARFVIVVDHSFSMVWDKCPSDLDGSNPNPAFNSFQSCDRGPGVDQEAYRYQVILKWLDEIENKTKAEDDIKVMILPFSGGKARRPHTKLHPNGLRDSDYMKFISITKARSWVSNILMQEHEDMLDDGSKELMGTTVFKPILDYSLGEIKNELDLLKEQDKLEATPFEMVFISDGVYKPTMELFNILRDVSGCPDCSQDPNHIACTCFYGGCWSGSGLTPGRYCQMLEQNFREYFGEPDINQLDEVANILNNILELPDLPKYNGLRLNLRLTKMNWPRVPDEDKNTSSDKTKNIFDELPDQLVQDVSVHEIASAEPPFSIFSFGGDSFTFIIKNIFAINMNVFVNRFGELVVDSDGDGLSDAEEIALGYDPQKPRSNEICLDAINENFGCQTIACNPEIDRDRDGLNECEEATMATKDYLFDSDADNIMDIYESLRGLNPNFNDSQLSSSGDGFSDHENFRRGLFPNLRVDSVQENYKIDLQTKFEGYDFVEDENGTEHAVGTYTLDLQNMPLLPSLAIPSGNILAMKESLGASPIPDAKRLDPISKAKDKNHVVFLMQITTMENPNKTSWHLMQKKISADQYGGTYFLDEGFQFSNFIQIQGSVE